MSDLDRLARQLQQDVSRRQWPESDLLKSTLARRATRRLAVSAAALIVIVLAGVTAAVGLGTHRPPTPATTNTTAPTPTAPSPTGPEPSPTVSGPPASAEVFVRQISFVSPDEGWLFASQPCPTGTDCVVLRHTLDGGRTWKPLPSLPAGIPPEGTGLQFANSHVGYLFGRDVFYMSTDGGITWTRQPGDAEAIAVANGTALRLSIAVPGCQIPGCTYRISSAPVGTGDWRTIKTGVGGGSVQLVRQGHRAIVAFYGNPAGGVSARATVLTSGNDGRTWTTRADPCPAHSGPGEIVAVEMAMAPDGSLTVLCYQRGTAEPAPDLLITSTDGGATFGPPHATPADGDGLNAVLGMGEASADTLFVSTLNNGTHRLFRSDNAGVSWTPVATAPGTVTDGAVAPTLVVFPLDAQTGYWLPGQATIFVTHDSGQHWSAEVPG